MLESLQHKLDRVRPPRVQITYDVEIGNAIVMKELPFVMGIMADLSGMPTNPLPKMSQRKFVEIDRDNLDEIMEKIQPRLAIHVDNKLANDGSHINAELFFNNMDDFNPLQVVKQIEPLRNLYESRTKLKDMLTRLDGNDILEELLMQIINDSGQRNAIMKELGTSKDGSSPKKDSGTSTTGSSPKKDSGPSKSGSSPKNGPSKK